jgi:hypothetical protein
MAKLTDRLINLHSSYSYDQEFSKKLGFEFTAVGSDKSSHHGYEDVYSYLLSDMSPKSFLEIGLFLGDTHSTDLFAWEKMFPEAKIYGADIKEHLLFKNGRIETFFVDQSRPETFADLKNLIGDKVDIILDDASHVYELTIATFENMFDFVTDDGIYLIEDILFEDYNMDSWEQRSSQLKEYFDTTGLVYSMYATSKVHSCVDSVVLAVFKGK